jgi:hypothetical protein
MKKEENRNSDKHRWIYIVATKTSLKEESGERIVEFANVGETKRTPRERLKEYRKSGGGQWELLESFEVHPDFSDKFIHAELKELNYKNDPRRSRNTEEFRFDLPVNEVSKFIKRIILRAHEIRGLQVPKHLMETNLDELSQGEVLLEVEEKAYLGSLFLNTFDQIRPELDPKTLSIFCEGQSTERSLIENTLAFDEDILLLSLSSKLKGEQLKDSIKEGLFQDKKIVIVIPSVEAYKEECLALSRIPLPMFLFYSRFSWGYPLPLKNDPFVNRIVEGKLPTRWLLAGLADLPFNVPELQIKRQIRIEHLDYLKQ